MGISVVLCFLDDSIISNIIHSKKRNQTEWERYLEEEAIQELEIEKQQKERLAAKLRELGINH